jgi:hypothetical protein
MRIRTADRGKVIVTDGHEAEAIAAQRKKKPSRIGEVVLKLLGFRGQVGPDYVGKRKSRPPV